MMTKAERERRLDGHIQRAEAALAAGDYEAFDRHIAAFDRDYDATSVRPLSTPPSTRERTIRPGAIPFRPRPSRPGPARSGASLHELRRIVAEAQADATRRPAASARPAARSGASSEVTPAELRTAMMSGPSAQKIAEEAQRTAYHEAGHAVAFFLEGCGIQEVRLRPYRDGRIRATAGRCASRRPGHSPAAMLAGIEAEQIAFPHQPGTAERRAWAKDIDHATEKLKRQGRSGYDVPAERRKARETMRQYWPAVHALASALLERVVVDGDEAERIVATALGIRRAS